MNSGQPGPSGRNTPQRRISGADYNKVGAVLGTGYRHACWLWQLMLLARIFFSQLNYLVTSLEGARGDRGLKVEGSARLPQVSPVET